MIPLALEFSVTLKISVPVALVKRIVPRPSAWIEYVLALKESVCSPLRAVFTSSTPPVILPLPSAMKAPTRAKNPPISWPLIRNAYWPLRLALEKLPTGGGGRGVELPPLHAAARTAEKRVKQKARRFTVHPPSAACGLDRSELSRRPAKEASPSLSAQRAIDYPAESPLRRTCCRSHRGDSRPRCESYCLQQSKIC